MATKRKRTKAVGAESGRRQSSTNRVGVWLVGGAVLLVVLVIMLVRFNQTPATVDAGKYTNLPASWLDHNVLGDPNAPVTIQTWEDFL